MNAVFEPSLLFISDEDWYDEEKKDEFLEHLANHLEIMDEYDICKIWWTEELYTILLGDPNMHPWFGSDSRIVVVPIIYKRFYSRIETIFSSNSACESEVDFKVTYTNQDAHHHFLRLAHSLIDLEENFYCCLGVQNNTVTEGLAFFCACHSVRLTPHLLRNATAWLNHIDAVEKFFPKTIEAFDEKFEKGMNLVLKQRFSDKKYLFDYEFTKTFKKNIVGRTNHRAAIFVAIVKKLTSTRQEAANSELHDEFIGKGNINEYRIRVTQRPSSTRIHYVLSGDKINFLNYYGEGEHDDGL